MNRAFWEWWHYQQLKKFSQGCDFFTVVAQNPARSLGGGGSAGGGAEGGAGGDLDEEVDIHH